MKLFGKVLLYIGAGIVIILAGLFLLYKMKFPAVGPAEDIKVEITDDRIERGKYLFNHVSMCGDCHTTRDWHSFSAPIKDELFASGNFDEFVEEFNFPGNYYASNLTPANLGNWSDGEIIRAITTGVNKEDRALFPVMPYLNYGKMSKEDIYSIIAYIRTLEPIERETPKSKPSFPMNIIINTIPEEAEFSDIPDRSDKIAYGKYMTNAAACFDCHTKTEKGKPLPGMEYAGGFEFKVITGGVVRSANITPDKETGIGNWSREQFIGRFKSYADSSYIPHKVGKNEFNTWMPWTKYAGMQEEDLGAIYDYLMSLNPVNNPITKFEPNR